MSLVLDSVWMCAALEAVAMLGVLVVVEWPVVVALFGDGGGVTRRNRRLGRRRRSMVAVLIAVAGVNAVTLAATSGLGWLVAAGWEAVPGAVTSNGLERMIVAWRLAGYETAALAGGLVVITGMLEWAMFELWAWTRRRGPSGPGRRCRRARDRGGAGRGFAAVLRRTVERRLAVIVVANGAAFGAAWWVGVWVRAGVCGAG